MFSNITTRAAKSVPTIIFMLAAAAAAGVGVGYVIRRLLGV